LLCLLVCWQGFKLGHTVIDRKTLSHTAFKLISGFTTIYAVLVAMTETPASRGGNSEEVCELSAEQMEIIQLVLGQNSTNCLNVTFAAMLGAQ
jgi:hypothetical protein